MNHKQYNIFSLYFDRLTLTFLLSKGFVYDLLSFHTVTLKNSICNFMACNAQKIHFNLPYGLKTRFALTKSTDRVCRVFASARLSLRHTSFVIIGPTQLFTIHEYNLFPIQVFNAKGYKEYYKYIISELWAL